MSQEVAEHVKTCNVRPFANNSSVNASTKCTPFEMMYGRKPSLSLDLMMPEIGIEIGN